MLEIKNLSEKDLKETEAILKKFVPYAQKQLGYDQPVKLMFISDPDNATNPLGKTAHYQPGTKVVTVYVDDRHPKDIMRSVSHELVHHAQNCRGEFDKTPAMGDGYAQADEHLREMEREAYEKGNLIFRDFEDGLKTNNKEMTIYIDDSSGEVPANLHEEKKMKKNKFGLNSPHAKWQAFLLNERADKKKAAWMQAFQNAAGNPQPPPQDFWDTATYLYNQGEDPVAAGEKYAANNMNEGYDAGKAVWMEKFKLHAQLPQNQEMSDDWSFYANQAQRDGKDPKQAAEELVASGLKEYGDHETQASGGLVASGYSSEPSMDFVEDIARDVVDGGGSLMQIATALKDQGFDANLSSGALMIQGTEREKFFIGKASNFDIDPNEETRQIGPYVLGFMDSSMNEALPGYGPDNRGDRNVDIIGSLVNQHGFMNVREPLEQMGFTVDFVTEPLPMYNLTKDGVKYAALNKKYVDDPDLVVGDTAIGAMNEGDSPKKPMDSTGKDSHWMPEGLTADGKEFNIGDMVQVTGGGAQGATGEIIEFAEGKAVVRLESDADRRVFGQATDEIIVRGEHLAPMDGMNEAYQPWRGKRTMADLDKDAKTRETDFLKKSNAKKAKKDDKDKQIKEMYGEDDDYFMELEKEFPFLSKAVKTGEVPEEVAAEIAKEYGDKDEMPSGEELKESLRRVVKRVLFEELKGGQKELDADGDGDIGADDLANLRNKKKPKNEAYSRRAVLEAVIRKTIIGEEIDTSQFPNPLPKDQSGETFLSKGMRDGEKGDDVVPAGGKSIAAQDAKPSQSAIYLGKALGMAVGGVKGGNINALISADNYILDGHHRWAATMFADPSAAISGTGIGMSMTELIPVLRAAGDAYGNARRGEPAGGDVNIFKASLDDAKNAIQKMDGGTKFTKPGAAGKWLESIGGEEELAKRLEAIKAKGGDAASAPPRNEMPVIDADKGEDKNIATRLNKGAIDVKPPYADPGSDERNKEPRPMNESRKNRIHNERYDLLMEQMLGIKPITPLSDRNNWLLEEEGKDEEDDSNNPMGYCDERSFMSAQEAEKEALGDEEENYSKSEIDALHKHPKDLKNN